MLQRLLDHLNEAAFFSAKDLESISHNLDKMQESVERGKDKHSPHLLTLLQNRMDICRNILAGLQQSLADLPPALTPIHERLVSILRSISAANTRSKVSRTTESIILPRLPVQVSVCRSGRLPKSSKGDQGNDGEWPIRWGRQHYSCRSRYSNCTP